MEIINLNMQQERTDMGMKIGILGVGKMGGILLKAFLHQGLTDKESVR